jgi:hypothetical protein
MILSITTLIISIECHYAECGIFYLYAERHYAAEYRYAKCGYAESRYAECCYVECNYAERRSTVIKSNSRS